VHPKSAAADQLAAKLDKPISREYSYAELLKRPEIEYADLAALDCEGITHDQAALQISIQAKYAGYIDRQQDEIGRVRRYENLALPATLDYSEVPGLSNEVRDKLTAQRPPTLGRASRIPGVTPAAISLLLVHMKRSSHVASDGPDSTFDDRRLQTS
jgi:tRNA uridine 5-carboxymethylaminomethyl modification enzyme